MKHSFCTIRISSLRRSRPFFSPALVAGLLALSTAHATETNESYRTGFVEPTPEQQAWMDQHLLKVERIKVNDLGLARINAHLLEQGKTATTITATPCGLELEGIAGDTVASTTAIKTTTADDSASVAYEVVANALPSAVDNSLLDFFPPIGTQKGNECSQFASVYYTFTHMTAMARGWNAKTGGSEYRFNPMFTYAIINNGYDSGSYFPWNILLANGCARQSLFPYTSDYLKWADAEAWRDAINYRADQVWSIEGLDSESVETFTNKLQQVKAVLNNGYVMNYSTFITTWEWKTAGDNPSTTADDSLIGDAVAYCQGGHNGSHAMTIVGYNDEVWCDVNENSLVDDGESGAFRVCNSWGTEWKDSGFAWILYDAIRTNSTIANLPVDAPERDRAIFKSVYGITAREEYTPHMLTRITMNHAKRTQIHLEAGVNDGVNDVVADDECIKQELFDFHLWVDLIGDGGNYAFDGTTNATDATFYFDLSDVAADSANISEYYVQLSDNIVGDPLLVKEVALIDNEQDHEWVFSSSPITLDNATNRFALTYSPLPFNDDFEEYSNGQNLAGSNGWANTASAAALDYSGAYTIAQPLPDSAHTQVQEAASSSQLFQSSPEASLWFDSVTRFENIGDSIDLIDVPDKARAWFAVDENGYLNIYHAAEQDGTFSNGWTALEQTSISSEQMVRLTIETSYADELQTRSFFRVYLDGGTALTSSAAYASRSAATTSVDGTWFLCANPELTGRIMEARFDNMKCDDLVLTTDAVAIGNTLDSDGDGAPDWQEQVADTDLTDSNDCFRITGIEDHTVYFDSSDAREYVLYWSTNLTSGIWTPATTGRQGVGGSDSLSGTNSAAAIYYKVEVSIP